MPCFTPQRYQLSTTVPVSRMPMPPVSGHQNGEPPAPNGGSNSNVALKPIVQRQNSAARSDAVPRSSDLFHFAVGAVPADGQHRAAMHGEQHGRAIQERDREHVERIVEQVAVAERERRGPVQMREDAERHRLRPAAHQQRTDEAEHEIQPDRRGKRPRGVRAQPKLRVPAGTCAPTTAGSTAVRKKPAIIHQPPCVSGGMRRP